jgi:broad specificity phosphatase PhoE
MKNVLLLVCSLVLLSCGSTHYCYVVRHAEKLDNTPYSVLSPEGHKRAAVLRNNLQDKKIEMIFATTFQRTQETARPLADALQEPLLIYRNNAVDSIAEVIRSNRNKNILLVGHSGNLPSIIEKITGQKVEPIGENQYDKLYILKFRRNKTTIIEKTY